MAGYFQKKKYAILKKAFKDDDELMDVFENWYPKVKNFIWTIGIFIGFLYIMFNMLDRIGFHKTIIILMVSISVYMRSWFKMILVHEEKKK